MSEQQAPGDEVKARQKQYKKSLNLPRTAFPMRANLAQNEPASRKRWEKDDLYRQLLEIPGHVRCAAVIGIGRPDAIIFRDG
jgi:hypothetical protein